MPEDSISLGTKSSLQTGGSTSYLTNWECSVPVHINTVGFTALVRFEVLLKNSACGAAEILLSGPDCALCKLLSPCHCASYRCKWPARCYYRNMPAERIKMPWRQQVQCAENFPRRGAKVVHSTRDCSDILTVLDASLYLSCLYFVVFKGTC